MLEGGGNNGAREVKGAHLIQRRHIQQQNGPNCFQGKHKIGGACAATIVFQNRTAFASRVLTYVPISMTHK